MSGKNPLGLSKEPQAYEGANIIVPVGGWRFVRALRNPTTSDLKYPVGTLWINTSANSVYFLTSVSAGSATWTEVDNSGGGLLPVANGGTGASTLTAHGVVVGEGTSAVAVTAAGTVGQVLVGNGASADPSFANLVTLNVVDVTGTSQAMAVNTTYIADNAAQVAFTLPATAAQGSIIKVIGNGAGGWTIGQNANQVIKSNGLTTTTGTGGSLSSTNRFNTVEIFATVGGASTTWVVAEGNGTYTFV